MNGPVWGLTLLTLSSACCSVCGVALTGLGSDGAPRFLGRAAASISNAQGQR
jgi:hypothetical protein